MDPCLSWHVAIRLSRPVLGASMDPSRLDCRLTQGADRGGSAVTPPSISTRAAGGARVLALHAGRDCAFFRNPVSSMISTPAGSPNLSVSYSCRSSRTSSGFQQPVGQGRHVRADAPGGTGPGGCSGRHRLAGVGRLHDRAGPPPRRRSPKRGAPSTRTFARRPDRQDSSGLRCLRPAARLRGRGRQHQ